MKKFIDVVDFKSQCISLTSLKTFFHRTPESTAPSRPIVPRTVFRVSSASKRVAAMLATEEMLMRS